MTRGGPDRRSSGLVEDAVAFERRNPGSIAAAAVGLGLYGRSILSASTLTPDRSIDSLRRDGEVLSESVSR